MAISIRPARADDLLFLEEMMVVASNWDPGRPFLPLDRLLEDEHMRRYFEGWGRPGDVAIIAEEADLPLGATWRRFYPSAAPGYGFIAETIPEVSIGVRAESRGRGIGASLLDALADDARRAGLSALSLSVELGNPAARLYQRQGYRTVRSSPEDHVMRLDLE
jgi:ribosomal protein S18 acetylase RimI-like enzyme